MLSRALASSIEDVRPESKYGRLLRPIGAFLNTLDATHLTLAETGEAFIWRCFQRQNPAKQLTGVIAHSDIPGMAAAFKRSRAGRVAQAGESPLGTSVCPWGYEELLRSLSHKLDQECATTVMVYEDDESLLVQFSLPVPLYVQMEPERFASVNYFHEEIYSQDDIVALVATMRSHRGSPYYR
ncbi:MAG: hypothetical protein JWO42_3172 [Chloroflexi bacterium]|jgi:hypothetical protein|nr:hypothetical protein [Chloroflexota bacterium]